MGDKKRSDKRRQKRIEDNSISIERFLSKILGVDIEELLRAHLTHKDLKAMFPKIKTACISKVLDDPALVATGQVIYVIDSTNRCLPYINDKKEFLGNQTDYEFSRVMDSTEWNQSSKEVPRINYDDLSQYKTYELCEYAKTLYELGLIGAREKILREIRTRDDSKQGVKRSKQKALKKDEKYLRKIENEDY